MLCHTSVFDLSFFFFLDVDRLSLCVLRCDFMFSVGDAVCLRSCTLIKKDVDFVSGRPGFQIPTPIIYKFNVCMKKK